MYSESILHRILAFTVYSFGLLGTILVSIDFFKGQIDLLAFLTELILFIIVILSYHFISRYQTMQEKKKTSRSIEVR